MHKQSLLALSVAALLPCVAVKAANLPVAYDIIDLGALEPMPPTATTTGAKSSFGYAINNDNSAVGVSIGAHDYTSTQVVNGVTVVEDVTINLVQSVYFPNLNRQITPPEQELGFGVSGRGNYATTINDESNGNGLIGGYAFDKIEIDNFDNSDNCTQTDPLTVDIRRAFMFDLNDQLTKVPANIFPGQDLGTDAEYMTSAFLGSNQQYMVGYVEQVTQKDSCGNAQDFARRGMIYNVDTAEVTVYPSLETTGDQVISATSVIRSINANGDLVGASTILDDDEERRTIAVYGNVADVQFTSVAGLEGATSSSFEDLNDQGIMVGGSNKADSLNNLTAFYYDSQSQESVEIGYLRDDLAYSQALAINNDNLIVGVSQASYSPSSFKPFIFDADAAASTPIDLNSLVDCDAGWSLSEVRDINDNGWIVGTGTLLVSDGEGGFTGEVRAFALKPRNEPANQSCVTEDDSSSDSGSLSWFVLLGLGLFRRKRQ